MLLRDLRPGSSLKWRGATVTARLGPLVYEVCVDGRTRRAHLDHLLADQTDHRARPAPTVVPESRPAEPESERGESLANGRRRLEAGGPVSPPPPTEAAAAPKSGGEPSPLTSGEAVTSDSSGLRRRESEGSLMSRDDGTSSRCGDSVRRSERLRQKHL